MSNIVSYEEPFKKFAEWFNLATSNSAIVEPTAMCLATVGADNKPSARMILLKSFDERGFCFFTNFNGRKAKEIAANRNVALCFYWGVIGLQIRIEGSVEEVNKQEADDYFATRRRGSQIGAWASKQSQILNEAKDLKERIAIVEKKFTNQQVTRPEFWSGYRVIPVAIEFWQEGDYRIHERLLYSRVGEGWEVVRLYP